MTQPDPENPYATPKEETDLGSSHEKLIVLSTFRTAPEAHLFLAELANHGLKAKLGNENSTHLLGMTIAGPSSAFWVEVLILESDAVKGLEIKNQWLSAKEGEEEVVIPEWKCSCGETVDAGFAICWNCDTEFDSSDANNSE